MKRSKASLLIDDVAARLWNEQAQYDADSMPRKRTSPGSSTISASPDR